MFIGYRMTSLVMPHMKHENKDSRGNSWYRGSASEASGQHFTVLLWQWGPHTTCYCTLSYKQVGISRLHVQACSMGYCLWEKWTVLTALRNQQISTRGAMEDSPLIPSTHLPHLAHLSKGCVNVPAPSLHVTATAQLWRDCTAVMLMEGAGLRDYDALEPVITSSNAYRYRK